jgi:branched-chain amino acid transport system permease protein
VRHDSLKLRLLRRAWPLIAVVVPTVVIVLIGFQESEVLQRRITTMLMNMVLVIGLYIFAGNSGVLSFGHVAFAAIGAYATAIFTIPPDKKDFLLPHLPTLIRHSDLGAVPAALVVGAIAAAFAGVIGIPLMRLKGLTAALGLFAVLMIVNAVALHWEAVTRGTLSVFGVPTETTMTRALIVAVGAMVVAYLFQESTVGLKLRASRENEAAARSIGVNIVRERWIALVLSAFVVGVSGFLWAQFLGAFNPNVFFLNMTFITIAMLVIGGLNSLAGAVFGTIVVSALAEGLRNVEGGVDFGIARIPPRPGLAELGLAIAMLLILIFRSNGISAGNEVPWPRWARLRHGGRGGWI